MYGEQITTGTVKVPVPTWRGIMAVLRFPTLASQPWHEPRAVPLEGAASGNNVRETPVLAPPCTHHNVQKLRYREESILLCRRDGLSTQASML